MASGSGLFVENSIKVLTQNGVCQIDLCLGDITKLKKEDEVDVLVVSAFRGSYAESRTSVIGALSHSLNISVATLAQDKEEDLRSLYNCWWSKPSLNISVATLAQDKEEDLRSLYNCWWSKPLSKKLPFKRLLCFETRGKRLDGRPQELVANVFRCLVSILKNEDGTVITPLLNTGDQGYGEASMLQGMVEGAVNWMKAGLPLRRLKLVLYAKVEDGKLVKHNLRKFDDVIAKFNSLKERYEMQLLLPKEVPLEYDVYLSFSEEDEAIAKVIREKLSAAKDSIRIYDSSNQAVDKDQVFQQDMYTLMKKSARVVTVLTPNYLTNTGCMEQYNIALCCNRRADRDILAPVYVTSVDLMPTYMGLVQYVDCRPADPNKIQSACSQLGVSLKVTIHRELSIADFDPLHYDIFLSYCHRDTERANRFVDTLKKLAPDLKVFFDVQELKTGKSWQRTLYHSIDGSRCMLALISAPYLKSAVCQEEFSLAQTKHYTKGKQHLQLIPICLEELTSIQPEFTHIPMVKGTPDVFEDMVKTICPAVVQWLKGEAVTTNKALQSVFDEETIPTIDLNTEMESYRAAKFNHEFTSKDAKKKKCTFPPALDAVLTQKAALPPSAVTTPKDVDDVIFSYHGDDMKFVDYASRLLREAAPQLQVKTVPSNVEEKLVGLEKAGCIVPVLSPNYLENPECIEELHVAIWRSRVTDPAASVLFPIRASPLPPKPTYIHMLDCEVAIDDQMWAALPEEDPQRRVLGDRGATGLSRAVTSALHMAVYKILQRFALAGPPAEHPPKPALVNIMKLREQTQQITQASSTKAACLKLLDLTLKN